MKLATLFILCAALAWGQAQHTVTLTWQDNQNPAGTTYTVYRADGACAGTPTFTPVQSGVTAKTYVDSTVTIGKYCYAVTAVLNSEESERSNLAAAAVKPFPPEGVVVVVK